VESASLWVSGGVSLCFCLARFRYVLGFVGAGFLVAMDVAGRARGESGRSCMCGAVLGM